MTTQNVTSPIPDKSNRAGTEKVLSGIPRKGQLVMLVAPAALWLLILLILPLITLVVLSFQKSAFGADSSVFST